MMPPTSESIGRSHEQQMAWYFKYFKKGIQFPFGLYFTIKGFVAHGTKEITFLPINYLKRFGMEVERKLLQVQK